MLTYAAIGLLTLAGCGKSEKEIAGERLDEKHILLLKKKVQHSIGMASVLVTRQKLKQEIELFGEIAQETDQVVHIASPQRGILKSIQVELGQVVDENTPLAEVVLENGTVETLPCPCHGIVTAVYLKPGDRVDSLNAILTVINPDVMRASFNLYEKDLAKVAVGHTVRVQTLSYPEKIFEGKVVFISPRVDPDTRTVKIRVDVQNPEDHLLKYGMFVTGSVERESPEETLVVPLEAIHDIDGKPTVFVQTGEETFEPRPLQIGRKNANLAEVLEGVKDGEKVVAQGSFTLKAELLKESAGGHHD